MNNKEEGMPMQPEKQSGFSPKLRFPAFRDAEPWKIIELGNISQLVTERVGITNCTPYTITSGVGLVSQKEKLGRTIAGNSIKNYVLLQRNDFAYNKSSTKAYPEGFVAIYEGDERAAVPNSIFTCFRVDQSKAIPAFLDSIFFFNVHGRWLKNRIAVGARAHGSLQVSDGDLMATPVPLPSGCQSLSEQQKIADFFASINALIALESNKLDALKKHKKGLMQKLFPADGEAVPALRFPEFLGDGAWEKKQLSQLGELVSGLTYSPEDVRDAGLLVLRSSNIQNGRITLDDNVYVRTDIQRANPAHENDILICVRNGSKSLIGKNALIPEGMPPCTHGAFMTIFRAKSAKFLFQLFQTEAYAKRVSADLGATINSINGNQLKKYTFFVPKPPEQQKIADCLASLDDAIAAQARKIDALKIHKKGLMQQLFPLAEEAA